MKFIQGRFEEILFNKLLLHYIYFVCDKYHPKHFLFILNLVHRH